MTLLAFILSVLALWNSAEVNLLRPAPAKEPEIRIRVNSERPEPAYLNGYRKSVHGLVLEYHSSHPDANSALLVRANKQAPSISWESDPIPGKTPADSHRLIWLAGLEKEGWAQSLTSHRFKLFVNGDPWLTFENRKDASAKSWSVQGKNGSVLSFEASMTDSAGDLFGTMILTIPKGQVPAEKPLLLKIDGEQGDIPDWCMVFQYSFSNGPSMRPESALIRKDTESRRLIRLSFDNLKPGRMIEISDPASGISRRSLQIGRNIFYLSGASGESGMTIPIEYEVDGTPQPIPPLVVEPLHRRQMYLLPYSHTDIGYTDVQSKILRKQQDNLDQALQLIHRTGEYPPEARFKWNLEVLWPFESYMEKASEGRKREIINAIREDNLGLNALYANVLTGLSGAAEMSQWTDYAGQFMERHGVEIKTALVSDIPGFSWGLVPALAHRGVRYFASAPNPGDRIGFTLKELGDKPFYWKSHSGGEQILMWVAGASYAYFHEGGLASLGEDKILRLSRKLDESGYPYEIYQLPYTVGGDNGPPDPTLSDYVKKWNEKYESPRLIIATHRQLFEDFEKRYGANLPMRRGDFTPYWEDGAASSALETALTRQSADLLVQGQTLWSIRAPSMFPGKDFRDAWRNVILFNEHTWGASNSISEPDHPLVKEQWRIKREFAIEANKSAKRLIDDLRPPPPENIIAETVLDLYNTHSWPQSDVVIIPAAQSTTGDAVQDLQGNPIPSQRLSTGELALLVDSVPPLAARRLLIRPGRAFTRGTGSAAPTFLQTSLLSLKIDPQSGAMESLVLSPGGKEFVDRNIGTGLNRFIYVPGKEPKEGRGLENVRARVKEPGPLVMSILAEADAPGCRRYSVEYRLTEGLPRVDIVHRIDKLPVRSKEAIHIEFPFAIPGPQTRYDVASGIVRPELDQLPGACRNFFPVQSWVDVSNASSGVTLATPDAPLIEIGGIAAEQPWKGKTASSGLLYSYLMNNYWHTNYRSDQEGPVTFRYSIFPHGPFKPEEATRAGRNSREPLLLFLSERKAPLPDSLFQVRSPSVQLVSLQPIDSGKALLALLYNPTAQTAPAELGWGVRGRIKTMRCDSSGRPLTAVRGDPRLPPWGTGYFRFDLR